MEEEHKITVGIKSTEGRPKAIKIVEALLDLRNSLTDDQIFALRDAAKNPSWVKMAMTFLKLKK